MFVKTCFFSWKCLHNNMVSGFLTFLRWLFSLILKLVPDFPIYIYIYDFPDQFTFNALWNEIFMWEIPGRFLFKVVEFQSKLNSMSQISLDFFFPGQKSRVLWLMLFSFSLSAYCFGLTWWSFFKVIFYPWYVLELVITVKAEHLPKWNNFLEQAR